MHCFTGAWPRPNALLFRLFHRLSVIRAVRRYETLHSGLNEIIVHIIYVYHIINVCLSFGLRFTIWQRQPTGRLETDQEKCNVHIKHIINVYIYICNVGIVFGISGLRRFASVGPVCHCRCLLNAAVALPWPCHLEIIQFFVHSAFKASHNELLRYAFLYCACGFLFYFKFVCRTQAHARKLRLI